MHLHLRVDNIRQYSHFSADYRKETTVAVIVDDRHAGTLTLRGDETTQLFAVLGKGAAGTDVEITHGGKPLDVPKTEGRVDP